MNSTWNPWHGCHKCSPGCQNCYMYALDALRERQEWSDDVFRTGNFKKPLSKYRNGQYKIPAGSFIRVNMTSDTFLEEADEWRDEFWTIIKARPDVRFWLLTKRINRVADHLPNDWEDGYKNVCLAVSIENQDMVWRGEILAGLPAIHREICCAPLIGPLDLTPLLQTGKFDQICAGGENYNNPRPCDFAWAESLSRQCEQFRINFCWYETGTNLLKDGQLWFTPRKADQTRNAYFSRINRKFYEPAYELYDPKDGHLLKPEELRPLVYNIHNCQFCANRQLCNGCTSCGHCKKTIALATASEILAAEQQAYPGFTPSVP